MRRGTRVGQAYVALSVDGDGINEDIAHSLDDSADNFDKAGDEGGKRFGNKFGARFKKAADLAGEEFNHQMAQKGDEGGERYGNQFSRSLSKVTKRIGDRAGSEIGEAIADRLELSFGRLIDSFESRLEALSVPRSVGREREDRSGLDTDRIGRLFGAHARNNALNIFGRTIGGLTGIINRVEKAGASMFKTFQVGFNGAAEGASFFQKTLSGFSGLGAGAAKGIGGAFSSLVANGPAAVAAIIAVTGALTVMVSVGSALLALVTALAATIATALVGALAVAAGALGALVVAGGLAVAMFSNLSNAQKEVLKSNFGPVVERFRGLGKVLSEPIFAGGQNSPVAVWARNVEAAIKQLGPLAHIMGVAFGEAGKTITGALSSKGVQQFINALASSTQGLAPIIENLASAFAHFLGGISSFFAAITPQIFQFSVYLNEVATRFANFAASDEGQNKISNFVDRALTSLHSLWGFIKAVGALISELLFSTEATNAGNTIFDSMTQGLRNFIAYLQQGNRLEEWFQTGVDIAHTLGDAIRVVGLTLAALNNAGVIDGIASITRFAESAAEAFNGLPGIIRKILSPLTAVKVVLLSMFGAVALGIAGVAAAVAGLLKVVAFAVDRLASIPVIGKKFKGWGDNIRSAAGELDQFARGLASMPKNIGISIFANTNPAAAAINKLLGQLKHQPLLQGVIGLPLGIKAGSFAPVTGSGAPKSSGGSTGGGGIPSVGGAGYGGGGDGGADDAKQKAKAQADALASIYKTIRDGVKAAAKATDAKEVRENLNSMIETMRDAAKEFNKQGFQRIKAVANILRAQQKLRSARVTDLLNGGRIPKDTTLTEFAAARERLVSRLQKANQKLTDAIALRNDYKKAVTDAVKTFGELTTAQAKTIDGVEQALTVTDITSNLADRLKKIQDFQNNLRILLAQGLSNAAYKQLVDAGVEGGSAYAQALVSGGQSSIQEVNGLVAQIDKAAGTLGSAASTRLYQAGVDAAQGLVDGLESLSSQLNSAATKLGNSIALALKNALGIHSPSTVLRDMMDYVGDGLVVGLDGQHQKVGYAAGRLSGQIAVSPEVAAYAASKGTSPVSGNQGPKLLWTGDIVTPTEDPHAVAMEALNELTGRL